MKLFKIQKKNKKIKSKYFEMTESSSFLDNIKYDKKAIYYLGDIGDYNNNVKILIQIIEKELKKDDIIILLGDNFYPSGVTNCK